MSSQTLGSDISSDPDSRIGNAHLSLQASVTNALRRAIVDGVFKPGDRLVEFQLAEMFSVSRNPIREALRVLHAEGLVEINPRKGARVPFLSTEEIEQIIELRAELEGLSARYAARRCSREVRSMLQALLNEGNEAAQRSDTERLRLMNDRFHVMLAEAGKNRYLTDFMRLLRGKTLWVFANSPKDRSIESWREHAAVLESVIASDAELSALLASRHVRQVGASILAQTKPNVREAE